MKTDLSPTGRALRVLGLLQAQPGITAGQLAARLGVTDRAARRYVAILREAGIPVESSPGPYGGYRVGRGIRLPPLVFTAAEALGLVMAVLDGSHAAADADDPVGAALGKIFRALPENVSRPAATMRQYASAAPDRRAVRPGTDTTSALVAAVAAQHRVSIGYRSEAGRQWEEDVDPWAVVVRHGRWYLLCHSHRAGAVRAYRIDRVQSIAVTGEQFRTPDDVDYIDLLEQHLAVGWQFETKVVFEAPRDALARYVSPPMGRLEPASGHRCVLTGTTSNPSMYAGEWLAAIPIPFHVEGGPELRAAVAAVAERLTSALSAGLRRGQVCVCGQGERGWQVQCLALGMAEREVLTVLVDQFHYLLADRPLVWVWLDALGGGEEHKDVCVGDAVEQADRREQPPGPLGQVHVGIGALRYRRAVGSVPQPACGAGGPATIGRSVTVGECSITGTRAGTA